MMTMTTAHSPALGLRPRPAGIQPTARATPARRPAAGLRLTRRGRLDVVLALLLGLLVMGFTLGHVSGSQAAAQTTPATVVVQPGDTLWSIAARVAPDRDPRGVVARLRTINHLTDASVQVGQRLTAPA